MKRFLGIWILAGTLTLSVMTVGAAQISASETEIHAFRAELDHWRRFQRVLKTSGEPRAAVIARWEKALHCLGEHAEEILGPETVRAAEGRLRDATIRREFFRLIVAPKTLPKKIELQAAVEQAIGAGRKPESFKLLEFFSWAPEDLEELRKTKRRFLEELAPQMEAADIFRKTALHYSDATSAFKNGQIGTVYRNQISPRLWSALESTGKGLSQILETRDGLFRFFVLDRYPPRLPSAELLTPRIRQKIGAQRAPEVAASILKDLYVKLGVTIVSPTPTLSTGVAAIIGKRSFTLGEIHPDFSGSNDTEGVEVSICRAVDIRVMGEALKAKGIAVKLNRGTLVAALAKRAFEGVVSAEMEEPDNIDRIEEATRQRLEARGTQSLRSFEILRVKDVDDASALFDIFRLRHEAGEKTKLETLLAMIEARLRRQAAIKGFTKLTDGQLAGLGPEIHQELIHRCVPGIVSRPLYLADQREVVFVRLDEAMQTPHAPDGLIRAAARRDIEVEVSRKLIGELAEQCYLKEKGGPKGPPS